MRVFWKDGLRFEAADKRYTFKLGGRIHYDGAFLSADDDTKAAVETGTRRIEDGTEFRRARIEMSGEVPERVEWAAGYDFGPGRPVFRNLYAGLLDVPFGANVRAGQMKEPFGLEQITSSNNMTFLERSLTSAAEPAYNAGLLFWDAPLEERMSWAVGAFRAGTDDGEISKGDGEWAQTARVTGLPYISEDGKSYLHLGLSATNRSLADDLANFAAKPENNVAPPYLEIVNLPVDGALIWRPEVAWTKGRIALQGEYTLAQLEEVAGRLRRGLHGLVRPGELVPDRRVPALQEEQRLDRRGQAQAERLRSRGRLGGLGARGALLAARFRELGGQRTSSTMPPWASTGT